jgi:hypothetical protein
MPEDTIFEPSAIDKVRIVGTKHILTYVALYLGLGVSFALAAAIFGSWMGFPYASWASALLFFACGLKAVAVVLDNEKETRQKIGNLINAGVALIYAEIAARKSTPTAPPTLPALPAANDTIRVSVNGRGGEDIPRNELHGFDPRDLAYLFRALARGEKFTEANLELWELPYSHAVMGKAQEGTPYSKFIALCVRAGIIGGREPKKSGTLVVTDPAEMMRLVKELQIEPTP